MTPPPSQGPLIFDMTTGDEDLLTVAEDDSDSDLSVTGNEVQEEVLLRLRIAEQAIAESKRLATDGIAELALGKRNGEHEMSVMLNELTVERDSQSCQIQHMLQHMAEERAAVESRAKQVS